MSSSPKALQGSTGFMSLFFAIVTLAAIIGAGSSTRFRRADMVKLYFYTNLVLVVFGLAMWFLRPDRSTRRCGWSVS
jgi:Na+/melibiose symporter-like transporter